jgi:hypothetical protein
MAQDLYGITIADLKCSHNLDEASAASLGIRCKVIRWPFFQYLPCLLILIHIVSSSYNIIFIISIGVRCSLLVANCCVVARKLESGVPVVIICHHHSHFGSTGR